MTLKLSNNPNLLLFTSNLFPATFDAIGLKHYAVIGVGGNVGDSISLFKKVIYYIQQSKRVNVIQTAPLLKNPPFGFTNQPDFINSVIEIETDLSPFQLLKYLLWVEKRFGRKRTFKNAPRTLDLDIIFYDKLHLKTKRLIVPHPHFHERESVMIPLRFLKD